MSGSASELSKGAVSLRTQFDRRFRWTHISSNFFTIQALTSPACSVEKCISAHSSEQNLVSSEDRVVAIFGMWYKLQSLRSFDVEVISLRKVLIEDFFILRIFGDLHENHANQRLMYYSKKIC